ncbi:pantothenate kinase [Fictibacillus macauensis ZFHKF-1]|uniref:Pantothenate kinase n=1 Tax=Fictibacillus macauensis ZFHKF-1 TaxID=1196324 RepID=I8UHP8_9BACL|nr:type I pantothenate kinase [Fictibacillus macauensis]EIT86353.1 pantothenate kinase [Fictibacillus macauensis ZFHKF-1]
MSQTMLDSESLSPYLSFSREEWASLYSADIQPLTEWEIAELQGINENVSLDEVSSIYLPLCRLLNLYVTSSQQLHQQRNAFLQRQTKKPPFIIGIAGSVAVGKSTTSRMIQALLSRWSNTPKVALVTTDGFLYPNSELERKGLMGRKGFPESYDLKNLIRFLSDVKSGKKHVEAPIYSHLEYDILADRVQTVTEPDIVIVEGINVLQVPKQRRNKQMPQNFVSDYFDFSLYVDADEAHIKEWYVERFKILRNTAFQSPVSYFHRYASIKDGEADEFALSIWNTINGVNLHENILPTKYRAHLILEKGKDHTVSGVKMRKM